MGAFLLAYVSTCGVIGRAVDSYPESRLADPSVARLKVKQFSRTKDAYDLVFVGSSRFYRQLSPAIFDRTVQSNGGPRLRSFNLGLAGMRHHEIVRTVRWVLEENPARLKWIVIEPLEIHEEFESENMSTHRGVNWHTPRVTWEVWRNILRQGRGPGENLTALTAHLHSAALRAGNFGMAQSWALSWRGLDRQPNPRMDGFFPLDMQSDLVDEEWEKEIQRSLRKREELENFRRSFFETPDEGDPDSIWLEAFALLADEVRSRGVEPVFLVVPPTWEKWAGVVEAGRTGKLSPMFTYHDLRQYPDFYRFENLFNLGHLNSKGSRILTARFAREFGEYLSGAKDG